MQTAKAVGRQAASRKYDVMTALGVYALAQDSYHQALVLRLITAITARYNWQNNELSMGRAEMARLWSVTERTVKRDLGRLKAMGWLRVARPGARGRVTVYALDIGQMLLDTRPHWPVIGPDFVARMGADSPPEVDTTVVPFRAPHPPAQGAGLWAQAQAALHQRHPDLYAAWFQHLHEAEHHGHTLVLSAPTRFAADYIATHLQAPLIAAVARFDGSVRHVKVQAQ